MSIVWVVVAAAAGFLTVFAAVAAWLLPRNRRLNPAERERRRRLAVNADGRIGTATLTDIHDGLVCYKYSLGGVEYTASQDVAVLKDMLPPDPAKLIECPVAMKYLPGNPANSIVLCEHWSGLRYPSESATL